MRRINEKSVRPKYVDILFLKLKTEIDDESLSFCVRNSAKKYIQYEERYAHRAYFRQCAKDYSILLKSQRLVSFKFFCGFWSVMRLAVFSFKGW